MKNPKKQHFKWKKNKKTLIILLIFLFLIWFLLSSLKVKYTDQEVRVVDIDYQTPALEQKEICEVVEHTYGYAWIEWQSDLERSTFTPMLYLQNMEDRTGTYSVRYAFINNDIYPYSKYHNSTLINSSHADFYSEEKFFTLHPFQTITVAIATPIEDPTIAYWAYAEIRPPTLKICMMNDSASMLNQTKQESHIITVNRYESVGKYLIRRLIDKHD